MLAAVLLSQHRFGEAIAEGESGPGRRSPGRLELRGHRRRLHGARRLRSRLRSVRSHGTTRARDRPRTPGPLMRLKSRAISDGALEFMRMAADGTSPNDPESLAWHFSQVGDLLMHLGRIGEARLVFERAAATFPNHPLAIGGLARVKIADGEWSAARLLLQGELAKAPTPDLAVAIGDLSEALGDHAGATSVFPRGGADRARSVGERPAAAAGTRKIPGRPRPEYSRSGEPCGGGRAIAAGHLHDGRPGSRVLESGPVSRMRDSASDAALRTGSRDARVLWHAAEIRAAAGEPAAALELLRRIPARETIAEVRVRAGIHALHQRLNN